MKDFEALFGEYFLRVYRFARSLTHDEMDAEELTQQTFFQALRKIDTFEERCDPTTWLCSIAKNVYLNGKCKKTGIIRRSEYTRVMATIDGTIDRAWEQKEQVMRLHRQVHALLEPYREVFMLRVFGELKYAQIANLFDKTESWARVTYYRARQMIQEHIQEEDV